MFAILDLAKTSYFYSYYAKITKMHFETIQIAIFMTSSSIIHAMSETSVLPMS